MEKYKITVDNLSASILSLSLEDIRAASGSDTALYLRRLLSDAVPSGIALAVYPTLECDVALFGVYTEGGFSLELPVPEAILIFSAFWSLVRGTPCRELEILIRGMRTTVEIFDTPRGTVAVKLEKCKLLLSFFAELDLGMAIPMADCSVLGSTVRIIVTDSPSAMREHTLRGARMLHSRPDAGVVCALSRKAPHEPNIYSPYPTRATAALGAATYLFAVGEYGFDRKIDFGSGLLVFKDGIVGTVLKAECTRVNAT